MRSRLESIDPLRSKLLGLHLRHDLCMKLLELFNRQVLGRPRNAHSLCLVGLGDLLFRQ